MSLRSQGGHQVSFLMVLELVELAKLGPIELELVALTQFARLRSSILVSSALFLTCAFLILFLIWFPTYALPRQPGQVFAQRRFTHFPTRFHHLPQPFQLLPSCQHF